MARVRFIQHKGETIKVLGRCLPHRRYLALRPNGALLELTREEFIEGVRKTKAKK